MKRPFKQLAVSIFVGLLMLVMAAPAFAIGPPGGGTPADQTPAGEEGPTPAHDNSCDGQQGALDNVSGNPQGPPANDILDDFGDLLVEECG